MAVMITYDHPNASRKVNYPACDDVLPADEADEPELSIPQEVKHCLGKVSCQRPGNADPNKALVSASWRLYREDALDGPVHCHDLIFVVESWVAVVKRSLPTVESLSRGLLCLSVNTHEPRTLNIVKLLMLALARAMPR